MDYAPLVKRILLDANYSFVRTAKGDHELWESPLTKRRFVVDRKIKSRHMANGILKQAGLPKKSWGRWSRFLGVAALISADCAENKDPYLRRCCGD